MLKIKLIRYEENNTKFLLIKNIYVTMRLQLIILSQKSYENKNVCLFIIVFNLNDCNLKNQILLLKYFFLTFT